MLKESIIVRAVKKRTALHNVKLLCVCQPRLLLKLPDSWGSCDFTGVVVDFYMTTIGTLVYLVSGFAAACAAVAQDFLNVEKNSRE